MNAAGSLGIINFLSYFNIILFVIIIIIIFFCRYVWTIILCPGCHYHLGWRYMVEKNPLLRPKEFYGLSLSSISSFENYFVPVRDRHVDLDDGEMLVTF